MSDVEWDTGQTKIFIRQRHFMDDPVKNIDRTIYIARYDTTNDNLKNYYFYGKQSEMLHIQGLE